MNSDEFSIEDSSLVYSRDAYGILHAPPGYKRFKDHKKKNENAKLQELQAGGCISIVFINNYSGANKLSLTIPSMFVGGE